MMLDSASFKYSVKHTGDIETKLKQVRLYINSSHTYITSLEDTLKKAIVYKPNFTIEEFVEHLIKDKDEDSKLVLKRKAETREELISIHNTKDDLSNYKGTAFGYLSSVSDYISHTNPLRNSNNQDTINNTFINNINGNTLLVDAYNILKVA
jgi:hypothetical protein